MRFCENFKDYELIDANRGKRLERWGDVYLVRPDPQAIWNTPRKNALWNRYDARYIRSESGGGSWDKGDLPESWSIRYGELRFNIKPMNFKHTGLFPEQAVNWDWVIEKISKAGRHVNVLNLFAYTGGATVACLSAGANVCHVDAAKNMVERAKENVALSNIGFERSRFIVDDCKKFVTREIKRGKKYDAIILDPPSYGRGANGEIWKIENDLYDFVELCTGVLSDNPLFVLINSYTTGLQPAVLNNILKMTMRNYKGNIDSYEVCLPTDEGIVLPCGASGMWQGE